MRAVAVATLLLVSPFTWAQGAAPGAAPSAPRANPDQPPPATRERVLTILSQPGVITPARVSQMGTDADLVLIDLLRDGQLSPEIRSRTVDALAASGSRVARDQLVRVAVATSEVELPVLRRALLGLGWLRDARAPEAIANWVDHSNVQVRLDAAVALALTKSPEALGLLERRARAEKDASARQKVERLVKQLRKDLPPEPPIRPNERRVQPPPPVEGRRF